MAPATLAVLSLAGVLPLVLGAFCGLLAAVVVTAQTVSRVERGRRTSAELVLEHQLEQQLQRTAFRDPLTGAANRTLLADRLGHALDRSLRGSSTVLLLVDLDDFHAVNDSLGQRAGDELLVAVADRLTRCVRLADTVARMGADEFAVLLDDAGDVLVEGRLVAERVAAELREPYVLRGERYLVTASIGVACSPGAACRPDDLLHQAGVALATAKRRGKGLWEIYPLAQRHDRRVTERLRLRTELHQAVAGGELEVRYQPVVDLGTGRIAGVEALVRWQHPTRGLLGPEAFIGLAEDTGVIHGIGEHVLREACTAVRRWQLGYPSTDPAREPLSVGVNLSVRQLAEPGLVDTVRAALLDSGLPPASLTLEITETVLAHDLDQAARTVSALRSLGVRIAIDDFGTGYSSLSYLERLDVDVLKVDRSFIDRVGAGRPPSALLRAVVGLGNELGLEVVAEGVEQEGQVHVLAELGCGLAQGYHFARPLDELDVALLLERGRSGVAHFAEAVGQVRP